MSKNVTIALLLSVVLFLCKYIRFFVFYCDKINSQNTLMRFNRIREKKKMTITLEQTYLDSKTHKEEIERELKELDEKLKTPERTVEDIVRHIQLLKEYRKCK